MSIMEIIKGGKTEKPIIPDKVLERNMEYGYYPIVEEEDENEDIIDAFLNYLKEKKARDMQRMSQVVQR